MPKDFDDLCADELASVGGGMDDFGGFGGGDFGGFGGSDFEGFDDVGFSGLVGGFTGEYAPVTDGRSDYAPAPIYEGPGGDRFVLREVYPPGTQFFENSPVQSNGVWDWVRPGGGYDQATWLMRTFNDSFGGWGAGSPRATTGYRPF